MLPGTKYILKPQQAATVHFSASYSFRHQITPVVFITNEDLSAAVEYFTD